MAARARNIQTPGRMAARQVARHSTLDGAVIERSVLWWNRLSPRGQRGWLGGALVLLALLSGWSISAAEVTPVRASHLAPHTVSPLTPVGSRLSHLLGLSAYPTIGIVVLLGVLWLAEGLAKRDLAGRWLTFALLALWLSLQASLGLALPQHSGAIGITLATPLTHAPDTVRALALFLVALAVMGLALAIGLAWANIAAAGLVAAPRVVRRLLRRFPHWLHGDAHSAPLPPRAQTSPAIHRAQPAAQREHQSPVVAHMTSTTAVSQQNSQIGRQATRGRNPEHLTRGVEAFAVATEAGRLARALVHVASAGAHATQEGATPSDNSVHTRAMRSTHSAYGLRVTPRPTQYRQHQRQTASPQPQAVSRKRAYRLARIVWQTLNDHGAVTEVYPLAPDGRIVRLCIKPVERPKRDARGQMVADDHGRPIIVRTRISRILRLRDALTQELGVPDLRMISPDEDTTTGADSPDRPYVIVEIAW